MKNVPFVIFVLMLALPVSAQTEADRKSVPPVEFSSQAQKKAMLDEFAKALETSKAYRYTNSLAIDGTKLPTKGAKFQKMLTEDNPRMRFSAKVGPGTHTLIEVSPQGVVSEVVLRDTILEYAVLDLSTFVRIDSNDEGDKGFFFPANQVGKNRIFKSFLKPTSSSEGAVVERQKADTTTSQSQPILRALRSVDPNASHTWLVKDSSFFAVLNGKDYFYQKKDGVFVTTDPDAPVVYELGKTGIFGLGRKMKVLYGKDANGNPVGVSNVNNANKRGLGSLAGFSNPGYGNGSQQWYSLQPYHYGNPMFAGGNLGWGLGGGVVVGGGFSLGWGINSWGAVCSPFMSPNYIIAGARVWNEYTGQHVYGHRGNIFGGGGMFGGGGCGGCKSTEGGEQDPGFSNIASAEFKSQGGQPDAKVSELDFVDIAPSRDFQSLSSYTTASVDALPLESTHVETRGGVAQDVASTHSFDSRLGGSFPLESTHVESSTGRQVNNTEGTFALGDTHSEEVGRGSLGTGDFAGRHNTSTSTTFDPFTASRGTNGAGFEQGSGQGGRTGTTANGAGFERSSNTGSRGQVTSNGATFEQGGRTGTTANGAGFEMSPNSGSRGQVTSNGATFEQGGRTGTTANGAGFEMSPNSGSRSGSFQRGGASAPRGSATPARSMSKVR